MDDSSLQPASRTSADPRDATLSDAVATPRYEETGCSNCGGSFGPGDHGFSHCEHHSPALLAARRIVTARATEREAIYQHDALAVARAFLAAADQSAKTRFALSRLGFGDERAEEQIGWRANNPSHNDLYKCEFCDQEHEECTLIEHGDHCPIPLVRSAMDKAEGK